MTVKLFRNPKSSHCHRVALILAFLGVAYETNDLDMANGAHKAPEYLKISPFALFRHLMMAATHSPTATRF